MELSSGRDWLLIYTLPPRQPRKLQVVVGKARTADQYFWGRREHAWLLRCEGMTLRQIGLRLGVGPQRARDLIWIFARRVRKAASHTKWELR